MLIYNHSICNEIANTAVANVEEIDIGKTYWSNYNTLRDGFLVLGFASNEDMSKWGVLSIPRYGEERKNARAIVVENNGKRSVLFLNDYNIGAHYNPWFIFSTKEACDECMGRLEILVERNETFYWKSGESRREHYF